MSRYWFLLLTIGMVICIGSLAAQVPGFAWLKQATGTMQNFQLYELCSDYSGNTFVAGRFNGTIIIGNQSYTSVSDKQILFALDTNGNPLWVMPLDYSYVTIRDIGTDVVGNLYVLAKYFSTLTAWGIDLPYQGSNNFFVAKFSPTGEFIWVKQAGGIGCNPKLAVTRTGECYVSGDFWNTSYLSNEPYVASSWGDLFITKLDTSGNFAWVRYIPCERGVDLLDIAVDNIGNCYITGEASWGITFGDTHLEAPSHSSIAYYAKYNYLGACTMVDQIATYSMDETSYTPRSIVPDEEGGHYLYYTANWGYYSNGSWHEQNQVRVRRTSVTGQLTQLFSTSTSQRIYPKQMFMNNIGHLVLTGVYEGQASFGSFNLNKTHGFFYAKLSTTQPNNIIVAVDPVQGVFDTYTYRSCLNNVGDLVLSFWSHGDITIGSYTSLERGHNLVKFNSALSMQWGRSTWLNYQDISGLDLIQGDQTLYTCGSFEGDTTMANAVLRNHGASDLYVAALNQGGEWLWAVSGGGSGTDLARAIAIDDSSNLYVTGYFAGSAVFGDQTLVSSGGTDIFIAKIDAFGNWLWAVSAGGTGDDEGSDLKLNAEGNLVLTGFFSNEVFFGSYSAQSAGETDIFVARMDDAGNWLDLSYGGGSGIDRANALDIYSDGSILVGGGISQTAGFGGLHVQSSGAMDAFIAKMGSDLNWLWLQTGGGMEDDLCVDLGLDQSGAGYITGSFSESGFFGNQSLESQGNTDLFLAKLDPAGSWIWAQGAGGAYADSVRSLAVDSQGNSVISGTHTGSMTFGETVLEGIGNYDIFLSKQDTDGNYIWSKRAGGDYYESANSVVLSPSGAIYICGITSGDFYTGSGWLDPNGTTDTFVGCLMDGLENDGETITPQVQNTLVVYPNPFSQNLSIKFDNPSLADVVVRIFNLRGQLVRTLMDSPAPKGEILLTWDGKDDHNRLCASAIYLVQVQTDGRTISRKLLMQRN